MGQLSQYRIHAHYFCFRPVSKVFAIVFLFVSATLWPMLLFILEWLRCRAIIAQEWLRHYTLHTVAFERRVSGA